MAARPPSRTLRTVSFGTLEPLRWGAGWFAGADGVLVLADGGDPRALAAQLEPGGEGWRLTAGELELSVDPAGPAAALPGPDEQAAGSVWRARVGGGESGELIGVASEYERLDEPGRYDSVRHVSAWFQEGEAVAVLALRPRKHKGHEQDTVTAAVIDAEDGPPIADPRLSTTYLTGGRPARTNLELWTDGEQQFPRRLAGETAGGAGEGAGAGFEVLALPLRCHSRGQQGTGLYLLARPA